MPANLEIYWEFPSDQTLNRKIRTFRRFIFIFLLLILFAGCGNQNSESVSVNSTSPKSQTQTIQKAESASNEKVFGAFRVTIPSGWREQAPTSSMRKAQFSLPGTGGDADLAVFNFPGQGGSVEANIDRWIGQFSQPDGSSSKAKAKTSQKRVSGLQVTVLDLDGTYSGGMMPGMSGGKANSGYRMIAAVVETTEGPWFFKLVGPGKTVAEWLMSMNQMIDSIQTK
jgi:hypothetical protein